MKRINLVNYDGKDIGEYIITDGTNHELHSSHARGGHHPISQNDLDALYRNGYVVGTPNQRKEAKNGN